MSQRMLPAGAPLPIDVVQQVMIKDKVITHPIVDFLPIAVAEIYQKFEGLSFDEAQQKVLDIIDESDSQSEWKGAYFTTRNPEHSDGFVGHVIAEKTPNHPWLDNYWLDHETGHALHSLGLLESTFCVVKPYHESSSMEREIIAHAYAIGELSTPIEQKDLDFLEAFPGFCEAYQLYVDNNSIEKISRL